MWGGRFEEAPDDVLWAYTVSHADRRLLVDDLTGSIAHVTMLAEVGLIDAGEREVLLHGLRSILDEVADGGFTFSESDEDVHSAVERRLVEVVGEVGGKLHTGRSRNDQIALDMRLHLRRRCDEQGGALTRFVQVLADLAEEHAETVVASYTHLQQAQAVSLGHHLLAYAWMLMRDRARLGDLRVRLDVSPLGANASGGSSLPLDPGRVAKELGMSAVFENSLDAVSARDLLTEYTFCGTQTMVTLSRLAEELVLWSSSEFGWVTFADRHTTGSSALPHKKNPDVAEHARGRSADAIGALTSLLVIQKGLPLAYNSDLQGDKAHVFRVDDLVSSTLTTLGTMLEAAHFHPPSPSSWTTALDLAEALVQRGVPFRSAHEAVGLLVGRLLASDRHLGEATVDDLTAAHELFEIADLRLVDPMVSVRRRVTPGGGSPASVRAQIEALRQRL
ncbi:argininosuccinate lyase [soil metagenome]